LARGDPAHQHEKKEHPDKTVQTFPGVAAGRLKSNTDGTNAGHDTLQQRAKVVSFGRRCRLTSRDGAARWIDECADRLARQRQG